MDVIGTLSLHPRGFGFLDLHGDEEDESAFVPPPALRGFLAGDVVSARVERDDRGPAAKDLRLERRWREELYGTLVVRRGMTYLRPDPAVGSSDWPLDGVPDEVDPDDGLVARIEGERAAFLRAVAAGDELTPTLVRWGVRAEFPPEVEREATSAPAPDLAGRRDLRDLPTVTIDGPQTRDIDDALAALPAQPDGAVRVLVSIADVDAAVPAGSALDREARRRGTSVYLPGHVIPMLPRALSEERLSLLPGQERAALTAELRIDPDGNVTAQDVYASWIRSHARLTYEGASAYLDEGRPDDVPEGVRDTLRWLRTAASRLSVARAARGGVALQREEVALVLDEQGRPTGVEARAELSAHRLVERLMVAANEAVAAWVQARGLPALYRTQAEPDPRRVARLAEFARNFGFEAAFGPRLTPRGLAAFEEQFQASPIAPQVRTVLRRVLGRARYQPEPAPHFGLASPGYLHYTSPIRRYADLAVHRVLKAHLAGDRTQATGDPAFVELGHALEELAFRASRAEDDRLRQLVARLFSERLGEPCVGHVVAVKPNRLVVQLAGYGVRGAVQAKTLPGGPLVFDDERETLVGPERSYVVGQRLELVVAEADPQTGRLELAIAAGD